MPEALTKFQVKARDGYVCLFSGTEDPAAAHLFPFATTQHKERFFYFRDLLPFFWGAEQPSAWRKLYEDARVTESTKNFISLNHQLHFWFDNARFALKPLGPTGNNGEIAVQWHWLKRARLMPRTEITTGVDIRELAGLKNNRSWGDCLAHRKSGVPIQTGQIFTIRAEKEEDLPDHDLLELQWNLLRVAAICGAADVEDDSYYDWDDAEAKAYQHPSIIAASQHLVIAEPGGVKADNSTPGQAEGISRSTRAASEPTDLPQREAEQLSRMRGDSERAGASPEQAGPNEGLASVRRFLAYFRGG